MHQLVNYAQNNRPLRLTVAGRGRVSTEITSSPPERASEAILDGFCRPLHVAIELLDGGVMFSPLLALWACKFSRIRRSRSPSSSIIPSYPVSLQFAREQIHAIAFDVPRPIALSKSAPPNFTTRCGGLVFSRSPTPPSVCLPSV